MKITTQNEPRLKMKLKKKSYIKRSSKKNQKSKDQVEKYNILQIRVKWLNWKETKLLLKSKWQKYKIKRRRIKSQITRMAKESKCVLIMGDGNPTI